jgi:NDP-sugar pyrophosphorylase family protein
MNAGILAAGWGTRLGGGPKALTRIGARTLVDLALEGLLDAGAGRVTCIVNETSGAVCEHVARTWPGLPVDWIVRTTPSSMHSFLAVLERLASGTSDPCLLTTIDAVGRPGTLREFVHAAAGLGVPLALGVTDVIDDEKPLYAVPRQHDGGGAESADPFEIAELSSRSGASRFVTAGYYWVSPAVLSERDRAEAAGFTALRQFLGAVVEAGYPSWGVPLPPVVDVDRPEDVVAAARLIS